MKYLFFLNILVSLVKIMTTCGETGFGYKKTKRNQISVFRSANRFLVYRLQHYRLIYINCSKEIPDWNAIDSKIRNIMGFTLI